MMLEEVVSHKEARYAILSHTWETGQEVQYNEFKNRGAMEKNGWCKIEKTCQLALGDGCDFAWIDTCCIDKSSSAELTEAINSMFPWYAGSVICYAYLADYDASNRKAKMSESRWFTRGWTLQELIAPAQVRFLDMAWNRIGMKHDLWQQLTLITGIGEDVLCSPTPQHLEDVLAQLPIARKMAWAAKRETTRIEDVAYCLFGLFGVNLPLLYGEGDRAFIRLQEEVAKNSNDLSLLGWKLPIDESFTSLARCCCGVLAQHPRDFERSADLSLINDIKFSPDFTMTNKGLKLHTKLIFNLSADLYVLDINCHIAAKPQEIVGIYLKHQGASVFVRAKPRLFASRNYFIPMKSFNQHGLMKDKKDVFLSKSTIPSLAKSLPTGQHYSFHVPKLTRCKIMAAEPSALWDSPRDTYITVGLRDFVGFHEYSCRERPVGQGPRDIANFRDGRFMVAFGFGYGYLPWVRILETFFVSLYYTYENWARIAHMANSTTSDSIDIYDIFSRSVHLQVKVESRVLDGEPVYSVKFIETTGT